jgi:hypothetical protein
LMIMMIISIIIVVPDERFVCSSTITERWGDPIGSADDGGKDNGRRTRIPFRRLLRVVESSQFSQPRRYWLPARGLAVRLPPGDRAARKMRQLRPLLGRSGRLWAAATTATLEWSDERRESENDRRGQNYCLLLRPPVAFAWRAVLVLAANQSLIAYGDIFLRES